MITIAVIIHILVSVILVASVLLHSGKGAGIGSSFGGAGGQALFGSAGPAGLLTKVTAICAIIFVITSVYITYHSAHKSDSSIMSDLPAITSPAEEAAPKVEEKVEPAPAEKIDASAPTMKAAPKDETKKETKKKK